MKEEARLACFAARDVFIPRRVDEFPGGAVF